MKIIKRGDKKLLEQLKQTKQFECKDCHCVFTADKWEYKVESEGTDKMYYWKFCPCCGNPVFRKD